MKSDSLKISKVFSSGGDIHYVLPHFQREFAWERQNWDMLLADALALHDEMQPPAVDAQPQELEHFLGSLVVINDGTRNATIPTFKLVDGQQRLTTISLLLCALSRIVSNTHPALVKKMWKLLVNGDESGDVYFKILPTIKYGDRAAYIAIIQGDTVPATESRIPQAYTYLYKELRQKITAGVIDPEKLFMVLTNCFQVVFIDLNQNESPYRIFESLNAKGKPLSQADLVRNYIAMKLPTSGQEKVFTDHWSKIEELLQEKRTVGKSRLGELTAFLRHYLAVRSGVLCSEEHVYARFRDRIEKDFSSPSAFVEELALLRHFAEHYNRLLRPENEPQPGIREAMMRLNVLEISTAYPFLLAASDAYHRGILSLQDFQDFWAVLENYMVRRYLVGEPTNYLNKMFPTLWSQIDKEHPTQSLREALAFRNYPTDERVRQSLLTRSLYDKSAVIRDRTTLILETINRHLSSGSGGYTVLDKDATLEHILPQTLGPEWQDELGAGWEYIYREYLHTLGNLTLVTQEWNSSLSNAPFAVKKAKLATHALRLNSDYFSHDIPKWDDKAIRDRATFLAEKVLAIWPALAAPPMKGQSSTKPVMLTIQGQNLAVSTWTDVLRQTVEFVVRSTDNFETVVEELPSFFAKEPFSNRSYQLSNGWWLYINLSAREIKRICSRLIQAAGIATSDWVVQEKVGSTRDIENPLEGEDNYIAEHRKDEPASFNDDCVKVISQYLGAPLVKQATIQYASPDKQYRVVCAVSKEYVRSDETMYWYAFHASQDVFLSGEGSSFVAYGCGSPEKVILIPYEVFKPLTQNMNTTTEDRNNRHYWHVKIREKDTRFYLLQPLEADQLEVTEYLLPNKSA